MSLGFIQCPSTNQGPDQIHDCRRHQHRVRSPLRDVRNDVRASSFYFYDIGSHIAAHSRLGYSVFYTSRRSRTKSIALITTLARKIPLQSVPLVFAPLGMPWTSGKLSGSYEQVGYISSTGCGVKSPPWTSMPTASDITRARLGKQDRLGYPEGNSREGTKRRIILPCLLRTLMLSELWILRERDSG